MCNRYAPSSWHYLDEAFLEQYDIRRELPIELPPPRDVGPFGRGVFVRKRDLEDGTRGIEQVEGQWGLIGWFAKSRIPPKKPGQRPILTNNARLETIHKLATYRDPWARGQRCVIPAWSYVEPNWESSKNEWWRFRRADRHAWGMAGLWNTWKDPETGELVESYTMVTVNCDDHPLLRRMHRPDPSRPETMQDKRAVVPLAPSAFETWLRGTNEEAAAVLTLPEESQFFAGPDAAAPAPRKLEPPAPIQEQLL